MALAAGAGEMAVYMRVCGSMEMNRGMEGGYGRGMKELITILASGKRESIMDKVSWLGRMARLRRGSLRMMSM